MSDEPNSRITAAEVLEMVRPCEGILTCELLALPVREAELPDRQTTERLLRRKAKEEAMAKAVTNSLTAAQKAA